MRKRLRLGKLLVNFSYRTTTPSTNLGCLTCQCNICGQICQTPVNDLGRETSSCPNCGSTVRMRAIIHLLSMELFGQSLALPDFPVKPNIKGMGLSDWEEYATRLAHKLDYTNTYYHQEPRLDIMAIDPALENTLDFLISTEVFEHVPPPASVAFENAYKLLKPGGVLIFTVPYTKDDRTQEHFPDLHHYEIIETDGRHILRNVTKNGQEQIFEDLVFHGGPGSTLEMRVFSEASLKKEFANAGFQQLKIYKEPCFEYGIYWSHDWSLPMAAKKQPIND